MGATIDYCDSLAQSFNPCCSGTRTVAKVINRGASRLCCAGGLYVRARGAWHSNLANIPLTFSVSCFNLGGLSPPKPPRDDGTEWNLPQMFALLMEPYAMIQVSILISVCFGGTLAATRGTFWFRRTPVEKHCISTTLHINNAGLC